MVFTGGCSHKQPLSDIYQDSRLLEGRQVFSTDCIVGTNSLGTGATFRTLGGWETSGYPSSQVPKAKLVSSPCKGQQSGLLVNSFLHPLHLLLFLLSSLSLWVIISAFCCYCCSYSSSSSLLLTSLSVFWLLCSPLPIIFKSS